MYEQPQLKILDFPTPLELVFLGKFSYSCSGSENKIYYKIVIFLRLINFSFTVYRKLIAV